MLERDALPVDRRNVEAIQDSGLTARERRERRRRQPLRLRLDPPQELLPARPAGRFR